MSRRHPGPSLTGEQLTVAWQSASLLLGYPDERLLSTLDAVSEAAALLPEELTGRVRESVGHLRATPLTDLQAEYVATFDTRRRCTLFLTYFTHGDTRKRGMALLRIKQAYLRAGYQLSESGEHAELPDHLCVVLEFGATVSPETGWRLLNDHRAGLELLRLALRDAGSPWTAAVEVVTGTLPRLRGDELTAVRRLAAEGPPEEEVGLGGYGPETAAALFTGTGADVPGSAPGGPPPGLPAPVALPSPTLPSLRGGR